MTGFLNTYISLGWCSTHKEHTCIRVCIRMAFSASPRRFSGSRSPQKSNFKSVSAATVHSIATKTLLARVTRIVSVLAGFNKKKHFQNEVRIRREKALCFRQTREV